MDSKNHKICAPKKRYFFSAALFIILAGWLFVGFDRCVRDHEVGTLWQPFIKSRPSFKVRFHNPAQYTLDFDPFDKLDGKRKQEFLEYCAIRYGMEDPYSCEKTVEMGRI